MRHRCLICGRFFKSPLPEDFACDGHVIDWRDLHQSEREYRIAQEIYRVAPKE